MENQLLDSDMLYNKDGKSLASILQNGYETHSSEYLRKGFELFKQNAGGFIGFLIISFILRIVASFIPLASIFMIPLTAGIIIVAKKIDKNEGYQFSNFFDGFQSIWPLIGSAFLQGLIALALMIIFFIPFFFVFGLSFFSSLGNASLYDSGFRYLMIAIFILVFIFLFIFVIWTFSSQLIVFNKKRAWEAMEISRKVMSKKYLNWLGFLLLLGLVNILGALCLLVGLLVTVPTTMCALYVAYEDVIGTDLVD